MKENRYKVLPRKKDSKYDTYDIIIKPDELLNQIKKIQRFLWYKKLK